MLLYCNLLVLTAVSGSPASVQMDEVRRRAQSLLSSSGSAQDVKAEVQAMAAIPLLVSEKYCHMTAEAILRENTAGCSKSEVFSFIGVL